MYTTSPLGDIAQTHNMHFHFYAVDTQLYITFKPSCPDDMYRSKSMLKACVHDIDTWMLCNKLKLNKDKTEVLIISSSHRPRPSLSSSTTCDETVSCSSNARNIGVIFDQSFCMVPHVTSVCKSAFFHLHNIGMIRKYLTSQAAQQLIHALVTSKFDYCNSLMYGLPTYLPP